MLKFNIMKLNIFGINWIKEIDVLKGINSIMQTRTKRGHWVDDLWKLDAEEIDKININYLINDYLDVCVQIKYDDGKERHTYHYFENLLENLRQIDFKSKKFTQSFKEIIDKK